MVRSLCHRLAELPRGRVVEIGPTEALLADARHRHTQKQLSMSFLMAPQRAATQLPAKEAMCSGPHVLTRNGPGDRLELEARAGYPWPEPDVENMVLRIITDQSDASPACSPASQIITDIARSDLAGISAPGKAKASASDSILSMLVKINTDKAPFKRQPVLR